MPSRLVALDDGPDIPLDRTMVVVGRHPQCDARLDSLRVSRHHCCMTCDKDELVVRDLGSTNGIRINGQRVEMGRLRPGDELSIAHIRYRLENGQPVERTLADPCDHALPAPPVAIPLPASPSPCDAGRGDNPLAAAVREMLPAGMADRCRIQVIVHELRNDDDHVHDHDEEGAEKPDACQPNSSP